MTYLDEAVQAALRQFGITDALARTVIKLAEPFIRADERSKLEAEIDGFIERNTMRSEDCGEVVAVGALESFAEDSFACVAATASHPTPDGPASPVLGDEEVQVGRCMACGRLLDNEGVWCKDCGENADREDWNPGV